LESKIVLKRNGRSGESEIVEEKEPEKPKEIKISKDGGRVEVDIKHVVRVHARDFEALKNSFEEWAKQWE